MSNLFIAHHGVDGMRWGQRNGPPYPLIRQGKEKFAKFLKRRKANAAVDVKRSLKKLKEKDPEEYENQKQKTLRSGTAKQVLNFQGDLTNQELKEAVERLNLEQKLKDIDGKKIKKGFNIVNALSDTAKVTKDFADAGKAIANMAAAVNKALPTDKDNGGQKGNGKVSGKQNNTDEDEQKKYPVKAEIVDRNGKRISRANAYEYR